MGWLFNRCPHDWDLLDKTVLPSAFEQIKGDPIPVMEQINDSREFYTEAFFEKCLILSFKCPHCGRLRIDKTFIGGSS